MTTGIYTSNSTLAVSAISGPLTGGIDVGSNNGNYRVLFTISDYSFFTDDDGLIYFIFDGSDFSGTTLVTNSGEGGGLFVQNGGATGLGDIEDDFGWATLFSGISVAEVPTITVNYTAAASFKPWFLDDFN